MRKREEAEEPLCSILSDELTSERLQAIHKDITLQRLEQKIDTIMLGDLTKSIKRKTEDPEYDLIGVEDVARMVRVSPKTVYNWIYMGKIECVKVNGRLLFRRDEIENRILNSKKY